MRIPISKSGSVRGLELLSRNLGRGSIDRGTKGSLNGGQPFRNDRCRRADRNFADSGSPRPCVATARRVTKWTGSTTFSDYLRVTLSLKLANLQFTAPVERLKRRAGGERGDVSNFGNFNCVIRNWRWIVNEKIRSRSNDWLDNRESCLGLPLYIYSITLKLFEN